MSLASLLAAASQDHGERARRLHDDMPSLAVILPAAGASLRFGSDKLGETLAGLPVLARTIEAFAAREDVALIVLATSEAGRPRAEAILEAARSRHAHLPFACVLGGATRAETVRNAARFVDASIEWLAVHDAARPLVSADLIDRTFAAARLHGAAAPALPVALTIKQATGPLPAVVERTVPRANLWAMQTPQVMRRADLLDAFARCPLPLDQVTDDVQLLELAGVPVTLVPGEERNLKLTTRLDLRLAELLLHDVTR